MPESATDKAPSAAAKMFGDFAPALVHFTDEVLFGEVWKRPDLAPRDRSLISVAARVTNDNTGQVTYHLELAKKNGATETELVEAITHLAFYTGWPKAMPWRSPSRFSPVLNQLTERKQHASNCDAWRRRCPYRGRPGSLDR